MSILDRIRPVAQDHRAIRERNMFFVRLARRRSIDKAWSNYKNSVNMGRTMKLEEAFKLLIRAKFVAIVRSKGKPPKVVLLPLVLP